MAEVSKKMERLLVHFILEMLVLFLLGFVNNGNAGITSSYIRSAFPDADIPLNDSVYNAPEGYNAPQQVHITQGDYNGTAVIVSWVTPEEPGSNEVLYGTTEGEYDLVAEGTVSTYNYYQYQSGYIHHCLLSNLTYDTKYYYKLGEGSNSSREFWFQTPPEIGPDVPYVFGIIGDLGQTYNSLTTLRHFMAGNGQAVIFLGDLSYADKIYSYNDVPIRWDAWGRLVENSTAYTPWFWSIGNHEVEYFPYMNEVTPFKNYLNRYPTPYVSANSSSPCWYSIRRASAHIIVLNSYSPFIKYTPQYKWLSQELENVNRSETPWLIVVTHVPLYSSNEVHYMEGEAMRMVFEEWFSNYKVDVIFSGHVHAYERTYRVTNILYNITNGICTPVLNDSAPMHITVGDGGNIEGLASNFSNPQPDYSAFREASFGHAILEIYNRTHAYYHWNRNDNGTNVTADSFMLLNQYWASNLTETKLKNEHLRSVGEEEAWKN